MNKNILGQRKRKKCILSLAFEENLGTHKKSSFLKFKQKKKQWEGKENEEEKKKKWVYEDIDRKKESKKDRNREKGENLTGQRGWKEEKEKEKKRGREGKQMKINEKKTEINL